MCMIDGGEPYELSDVAVRKARKSHVCGECKREILPGEEYETYRGLYDGMWYGHKTCRHCIAAREWLSVVCSGFLFESVRDDLKEHFDQGYGPWLGRAVISMGRGWKRKDGTLMEPMSLPENIHKIAA